MIHLTQAIIKHNYSKDRKHNKPILRAILNCNYVLKIHGVPSFGEHVVDSHQGPLLDSPIMIHDLYTLFHLR